MLFATASAAELTETFARCTPGLHAPLPALSAEDVARLGAGEVVRVVHHRGDGSPSTAIGLAVLEGSLDALWLAAQDPHANVDPALTEFVVRHVGPERDLWYGYLDLPSPLADRQWVVESGDNVALAQATGCWEHHWDLAADALPEAREAIAAGIRPSLTPEQVDAAVLTPVNHGAWLMAPLAADRTLVVYQATSVVGGAIPDWLVLKLTTARLESVLRAVETSARDWVPRHYGVSHAPVEGADGRRLEPYR